MLLKNRFFFFLLIFILALSSCSKTINEADVSGITPIYKEYYTIQVGQSMFYRLDSVVLLSFGSDTVTHTYEQKDSVMKVGNDLSGNLEYTVNSYIRPYGSNLQWTYMSSYRVSPKVQTLEMVNENNLRFVKLASPVTDNFSWDGNNYFMKDYVQGTGNELEIYFNWKYQYANRDSTMTLSTGTFTNTVTVNEIDQASSPVFDPSIFYSRSLSVESYAKGLGLIHRKQLFLTWQNSTQTTGYEDGSYGVELTRIQQ